MRCFIGLPLPESYQQGLAELTAELKPGLRSKLAWTRPGNWHLTLKFLGQTDASTVGAVLVALRALDLPSFAMRAGGAGYFPESRRPRVLWIGLAQGGDEAEVWATAVRRAVESLGFVAEERPFRAHLTVARIRHALRDDWRALAGRIAEREWPVIDMTRLVLWKSELSPQGARHVPLGEVKSRESG